MTARCKNSFRLHIKGIFIENTWYEYYIEVNERTGTKFYYVDGQPILERTFKENFDDIQSSREDKLNQILS